MSAQSLYEIFSEIVAENRKMGGVYLAVPTGRVLEEDETYVELRIQGKVVYGKMMMPHGWVGVPTKEWLERWGEKVLLVVAYEAEEGAYPVVLGVVYKDEVKMVDGYPRVGVYRSERFEMMFNDEEDWARIRRVGSGGEVLLKEKEVVLEVGEGRVEITSEGEVKVNGGKDRVVLGGELKDFLGRLLDEVMKMTVTTPAGPSGPPINAAAFGAMKARLEGLTSKKIRIE